MLADGEEIPRGLGAEPIPAVEGHGRDIEVLFSAYVCILLQDPFRDGVVEALPTPLAKSRP